MQRPSWDWRKTGKTGNPATRGFCRFWCPSIDRQNLHSAYMNDTGTNGLQDFTYKLLFLLVGRVGLEPTTKRL